LWLRIGGEILVPGSAVVGILWSMVTLLEDASSILPEPLNRLSHGLLPRGHVWHWATGFLTAFAAGSLVGAFQAVWRRERKIQIYRTNINTLSDKAGELPKMEARLEEVAQRAAQLEAENRNLRERFPDLRLEYDPSDALCIPQNGGMTRVRVVNEGRARATNVSVVLQAILPPRLTGVVEKPFVTMEVHRERFDISPKARVYVDILWQSMHASYGFAKYLAHQKRVELPPDLSGFTLRLRADAEYDVAPLELQFELDERRMAHVVNKGTLDRGGQALAPL